MIRQLPRATANALTTLPAASLCKSASGLGEAYAPRSTSAAPPPAPPGITELYLKAMDVLWAETPGAVVFFVAGAGQGGDSNWGSGFATDKATIAVNDYSGERPRMEHCAA
jgi:hypothetical protein